ncbi:unnamed protein product [Moneuplotes crassus]|uniref:Superkiller viralicidic activity 2-like 2 n=1 Tax=Euplotes crassus TaxID=5936 RepID=A0AAD1XUQ5_EUPCR|nr:unnamed protein product [Moneuplotes crassus]
MDISAFDNFCAEKPCKPDQELPEKEKTIETAGAGPNSESEGCDKMSISHDGSQDDKNDTEKPPSEDSKDAEMDSEENSEVEVQYDLKPCSGYNPDELDVISKVYDNCIHEQICPKGFKNREIDPDKPRSKEYKFTLDNFQEEAVKSIERQESVLVAAHTSAGKTAIAEYAIASALKNNQRVIYTSPIKALSNQKFRDLQEEFEDVGLMTGDATQNESAGCIVMTTEILRSMLYRGSEITKEMTWVIFDEVHYMRDRERGVVWEETIILLPSTVKYVFLSATIPNAREFAEWICTIKKQPCNVVYTDFRPVPLEHYIHPSGGSNLHLVVDREGVFREESFQNAVSKMDADNDLEKMFEAKGKKIKRTTEQQELRSVLNFIVSRNYEPCIVFAFSKVDCENHSRIVSKCEYTTKEEKENIEKIFNAAVESLAEEDQDLPQIKGLLPLLAKGIGVHHGGLLPLAKEIVEILFQEGLIKVLFTTETFSMGINMPARTVVFTSIEKYDGEQYRWLSGGEYIQMSGRAGRRGLDSKGVCILMANKKMEPHVAKSILKGKANPLYSSFHLKYNMLLNLMKLQDYKPEFLIKRSFKQFQNDKGTPQAKERLSELEKEIKGIKIKKHEEIQEYFDIKKQIASFMDASREIYQKEEHVIAFLVPGRLIHLKDTKNNIDWGWGIVVNFTRRRISVKSILKPDGSGSMKKEGIVDIDENKPVLIIDVLIYVQKRMEGNEIRPGDLKKKNGMLGIVPVMLPCVYDLSKVQMKVVNDLNDRNNVKRMEKFYFELMKRFDWCPPSLDPIKEMMIDDPKFSEYLDKIEVLEDSLNQMESVNEEEIQKFLRKEQLKKEYNELSKKALNIGAMVNVEDLTKMRRVLRRLDYIREDEVLKVKGNVASEISASDEIILTELLVNGNLHNLEPECIAAICSCLVFDESKNNHVEPKHPILAEAYGRLSAIIKKVAAVMVECKIDIDEEEYINSFKPDLVDITYKWCKGKKFEEICNMTDAYEGSIIRCFRRLEELLKQLTLVSKMELANPELYEKLEAASDKLKKGIVFASSLYL